MSNDLVFSEDLRTPPVPVAIKQASVKGKRKLYEISVYIQ